MESRVVTFNFNAPIAVDSRSLAKVSVPLANNGSNPLDVYSSDESGSEADETSSNESSLMTIDMNDSPHKDDQSWMDSFYGDPKSQLCSPSPKDCSIKQLFPEKHQLHVTTRDTRSMTQNEAGSSEFRRTAGPDRPVFLD